MEDAAFDLLFEITVNMLGVQCHKFFKALFGTYIVTFVLIQRSSFFSFDTELHVCLV
jgi:hypothetical protein